MSKQCQDLSVVNKLLVLMLRPTSVMPVEMRAMKLDNGTLGFSKINKFYFVGAIIT